MTAIPNRDDILAFRRKVFRFYRRHGRDLPFRHTCDPYHITVAEFMLQQTQVERVLPKYDLWLKKWPTWQALAAAATRDILAAWSGLGYNRRAIFLHKLAGAIVKQYDSRLPDDPLALEKLPGIGPYTARAILIFAFNLDLVTIDTNIRRVILHEFNLPPTLTKTELEAIARRLLPQGQSRDWHNALMDYSRLALPKRLTHIPPTTRQSAFAGSQRQIRGHIIKSLTGKTRVSIDRIARDLMRSPLDVRRAAESLASDGLIRVGKIFVSLIENS